MIDLLIIGGGPAALTAAIYSSREGLNVQVVEKSAIGGLISTSDFVDNYPGFEDGISGYELVRKIEAQARKFGAKIDYGEATSVSKNDDGSFEVIIDGAKVLARSVILAMGNSYRQLNISSEEQFIGRGIHFCATCDGAFYKDKKIVTVGGGDTAVQESLFLTKFSKVTMLVRNKLSAQKFLLDRLAKAEADGKIEIILGAQIAEFIGENGKLSSISINTKEESKEMSVDGVFEFVGLDPNTEFLTNSGVKLSESKAILANDQLETNLPGLFVAGDVIEGAEKQAIVAAASGAKAAIQAGQYLQK